MRRGNFGDEYFSNHLKFFFTKNYVFIIRVSSAINVFPKITPKKNFRLFHFGDPLLITFFNDIFIVKRPQLSKNKKSCTRDPWFLPPGLVQLVKQGVRIKTFQKIMHVGLGTTCIRKSNSIFHVQFALVKNVLCDAILHQIDD